MRVAEEIVPLLADRDLVAAPGEVAGQLGRVPSLEAQGPRGGAPGASVEPARGLHRGLRAEPPEQPPGEDRGLGLRLALAAHGAVDEARAAALEAVSYTHLTLP